KAPRDRYAGCPPHRCRRRLRKCPRCFDAARIDELLCGRNAPEKHLWAVVGERCRAGLRTIVENRDEYTAERVFWVPPEARWANIQNQAARSDIATLIDDAILAVERDNPNLKNKLPRDYARRGIASEKMKALIDLIADIGFKGDRAK